MHKDSGIHWKKCGTLGERKSCGGLGFRDLEAFNLALLAKQIWRVLGNPNSLAGTILKSKYFSSLDILKARQGHNPSNLWRSLRKSIPLVKADKFCRIGDGNKTYIWKDNWLPTLITFRVQSPIKVLDSNALVANLIDNDTKIWNSQLSGQIFNDEEASIICNLPLSLFKAVDKITWWPARNDLFSIQSTYALEVDRGRKT